MIKRYPHRATIEIETVGEGPFPETTIKTLEIKGRYEPAGQKRDLDQVAKFYCPLLDILKTDPYALNGKELIYGGRSIGISQAFNFQTHCELWLD